MRKLDVKHMAYHVLIALYFVWLIVFCALITMALVNALGNGSKDLSRVFMLWILFNLVMGTVLFLVIRLFRKQNALYKIIFYTYFFMVAATVTTVLIVTGA